MAYVDFNKAAPCGFLIVKDDMDYDAMTDAQRKKCTVLVQFDWDFAPVARRMGWEACKCGATDGTVPCEHRKVVGDMLAEAYDWILKREGESFEELNDYF